MTAPRLILASNSPRRRELLERAGVSFEVVPAPFDDAEVDPGRVGVVGLAMALAYYKAAAVATSVNNRTSVVMGADTLCIDPVTERPIGKPRTAEHARNMIRDHRNRAHQVVSGVAILASGTRRIFADVATVTFADLSDDEIDRYIDSNQWQGKAGGYNLTERQAAGWPIECLGDPETVVGLPMSLVLASLAEFEVAAGAHP